MKDMVAIGMFSREKEYVPFHSQCDCVGPVSLVSPWRCEAVMFDKCEFLFYVETRVNCAGCIFIGILYYIILICRFICIFIIIP